MNDLTFMRRCLTLAEQGRGRVGINPLVGAILVRNGDVIAEGFYERYGAEHAEAKLLALFTGQIQPDDTLYVSLEPCCHSGLRPPCTSAILQSGIKTVVYGMQDPDSRVAGKGITVLKDAGIEARGPVLPVECMRQNRGFVSLRTKHRPWVTLKRAQARSGEIANPDGSPLAITNPEQNQWAHEYLRARHDAILVGIGTVLADDPQLTVRLNKKFDQQIEPWRIVLDPHKKLPSGARVLGSKLIHITDLPTAADGNFNWDALWARICTPVEDFPGISSVLVEGGQTTWSIFRDAGMIDEEITLIGDL